MMKKLILVFLICMIASYALAVIPPVWKRDAPQFVKTAAITNAQLTTNVVTITTAAPHNFRVGEFVNIVTGNSILDTSPYTCYAITGVATATTFTYARTAGNIPLIAIAGTANVEWLGTSFENRGIAYNPGTGHILVARGPAQIGGYGVHIINAATGADVGELKVGADVNTKALTANVATLTTTQPHLLTVNQSVMVALNPPDTVFNGQYTVTGTPTATTFTYAKNGADVPAVGTGGFVDIFTSSTRALDKIRVANEKIYGSTLSISQTSITDPFEIYYWASEAAVPQVIFRNNIVGGAALTFAVGPQIPYSIFGPQTVINKELINNYAKLTLSTTPVFRPGQYFNVALPVNTVTARARTANVATLTTSVANEFAVGEQIVVAAIASVRTVTFRERTANVATLTLSAAQPFTVGQSVTVAGVAIAGYNGVKTLTAVGANTVSYAYVAVDEIPTADTGTVTGVFTAYNATATVTAVGGSTVSYANNGADESSEACSAGTIASGFSGDKQLTEVDYVNNILIYAKTAANVPLTASTGTVARDITVYTIRTGDTLDAVADGLGNAEIYTAIGWQGGNGPCYGALKFTYIEGAPVVAGITEIVLQGHTNGYTILQDSSIHVAGFGGNIYRNSQRSSGVWTNAGVRISPPGLLRLPYQNIPGYNFEYSSYGYQNAGCLAAAANGRPLTVGPNTYFVYIDIASCGYPDVKAYYNRAAVADITAGYDKAKYIDYTAFATPIPTSNTNGTGDIAIITGMSGRFAALPTNNFIGVFDIPSPLPVLPKTWDRGGSNDNWFDPLNWAPNGVPTAYDNVLLDHSVISAAYDVVIGGTQTAICRTLKIDPANLNKIALKINSIGLGCGAAFQDVGSGLSDLTFGGTLALPTTKNESYRPRYLLEILKGTVNVRQKARAANVATLTTVVAHNYAAADSITVNIGDATFDGTFPLVTASGTTFTYASVGADLGATACWGTAAIGTDTFRWNNINSTTAWAPGAGYEQSGATGVAITAGVPQALTDGALPGGITVTFAAGTGHYVGDRWIFNALTSGNALVISGDDTVTNDLDVSNGGYIENMSGSRYGSLPGVINNWGGGNKTLFGVNGNYVQQNYAQGTSQTFAWMFPPDVIAEYPVFDGATTWNQNSNYIVDIFGFVANFPSMTRSFNFGNVIMRNSYPLIYATAAYVNITNYSNIGFNNIICEAGTTFNGQTMSPYTFTVKGDLNNQGAGALSLDSTGGGLVGVVFDGTSNIVASAGTYTLPSGFTVNATKSVNLQSPYTLTKRGTVNGTFTTNSTNLTVNDATAGYGIQVKSGGIFQCSDQAIGGTGNFAVESGGTLNMKHIGGIDGQITVAGTKTYDAGGTYIYSGSAAQVTGAGLPTLIAGLGIDNTTGVSLSGAVATTNNLALTNGELITGANTLTAADGAGGITRSAGFVNGTLTRVIAAGTTGARSFPVGTAGKYAPAIFNITGAGSGTGTLAINTTDGDAPNLPGNAADAVNRYWTLTGSSISGWTADITFQYLDGDLGGADETTFIGARYTGPGNTWQEFTGAGSVRTPAANTVRVVGATALSNWTLYEEGTPVSEWMMF